jgi:TolB-like protein/class 3 adenylate cyclase
LGLRAMPQDTPNRIERRLSAIMAADVAGYSRLMHNDEEATHNKFTALITEAVHPAIVEHGGRIVKNTGDGFLAEFRSAVEAIRAAVQFQNRIKELSTGDAEDKRIAFRVGVNVGDVIVEPHDIFGDGVNIAARLEAITEPGGICISSSAYDHVRGKVSIEFVDLGEQNLKNIALPIRAYAVVRDGTGRATLAKRAERDSLSPPRLSIVVLPLANLSDDPEQEYFVDGVTESLTMDLSRISDSFVIARNSAFFYKAKTIDVQQIGRDLNVRYVLEGSVQRSANRLRVNVQLVDAETRHHLWADRFDKPIADIFDMQDELVSGLANTLNTELIQAEARRAGRSPHPSSLDLYFQGRAFFNKGLTPNQLAQTRGIFRRALALDSKNIDAMVWVATVNAIVGSAHLSDDRAALLVAAEAMLVRVLSLAPNHPFAHLMFGHVLVSTNRSLQGMAECERALALDRNLAEAHAEIGFIKLCMGRAAETEAHLSQAFRLSPRDIFAHRWFSIIGLSKLHISADVEAADWFHRSIETNRNYPLAHFWLATALALLGSMDQARAAVKAGLALDQNFTVRRYRNGAYTDDPTYLAERKRVIQGMSLAGVPEG